MQPLVDRLIEIQEQKGLDNTAMAASLGVGFELWRSTKEGRLKINWKMACGIARSYPELHGMLVNFMATHGSQSPDAGSAVRFYQEMAEVAILNGTVGIWSGELVAVEDIERKARERQSGSSKRKVTG